MKTADDYLDAVKRKNPNLFSAAKIKITPEQLGCVIKLAWLESRREMAKDKDSAMPEFMRGLFR